MRQNYWLSRRWASLPRSVGIGKRERNKTMTPAGQVQYLNPDTLNKNPAFTNVIVVSGSAKTLYVGGQNAVDASVDKSI